LPRRRALAARTKRQHARETGDRQSRERVFQVADLLGERRRALEDVGALALVRLIHWERLGNRQSGTAKCEHQETLRALLIDAP
jgi:hypothetical protein